MFGLPIETRTAITWETNHGHSRNQVSQRSLVLVLRLSKGATLKKTRWLIPVIALIVIAIDQVTKYLVTSNLPLGGAWSPFPGPNPIFQIIYTTNTGAAFGLFKDLGPVFVLVAIVVISFIIAYARRLSDDQGLLSVALGFMLGGSFGNLIDRLRLGGAVVDFIDVGIGATRWYTSNVSDMSIVLGVILLGISMLREERQQKKPGAADLNTESKA